MTHIYLAHILIVATLAEEMIAHMPDEMRRPMMLLVRGRKQ